MKEADHPALRLSLRLLAMQQREEWEAFAALAPDYIRALEALIAEAQQAEGAASQAALRLLQQLQRHDAARIPLLQARLAALQAAMTRLQQGKQGCQRYAAQMPRPPFPARF
ncbi:flagellar protein FliT [Pantoea sp. Z09]|uniref:flagellar protein FliT n=1 Tax=Pantoea sp. Z09 TaxID=2886821 RepID=UPI001EFEB866|nr:flagellar protein FliT [Pantoea sp. Z09]